MHSLFDSIQVGDLALANRIVMAPMTRNRSPNAIPNALTATYYAQRATAGLLIAEATAITQQGQGYVDVPGLYAPEQIAGWKSVTQAVHQAGGKIVVQLWHVGRISHTTLQPNGDQPVAPSAITADAKTYLLHPDGSEEYVSTSAPRALALKEISGIVDDYRRAARVAIDAGFDGVEIHSANGYLIDQFLQSNSNHRTDAYGGSIENRARFLLEVVDAVTKEIGAGRVGIRLSPSSPVNDMSDADPATLFTYVVEKLAPFDLAYLHFIEGVTGGPREGRLPLDFDALRAQYRAAGGKAAWMGNNGYTRDLAQSRIESGKVDLVSFGIPFLANPDLVRRLRENAPLNAADRSTFFGGGAKGLTDYPTL